MKKDETAYLARDNTIFKAPLRDSIEPSPFPNPIFLSSVPDYMTSIFRSTKLSASCSSSNSLVTPLLAELYAVESLTPL